MYISQWYLTLFSYRYVSDCDPIVFPAHVVSRFPLDIVYRIYDNILASGVESIFGFSLILLVKNEEKLLSLKFDEILAFLNGPILDVYLVRNIIFLPIAKLTQILQDTTKEAALEKKTYRVDEFVSEAVGLRITPFMLDSYAREYEEMVRSRDAQLMEMDTLRNSNRVLSSQV
jgi:hypothetical protein